MYRWGYCATKAGTVMGWAGNREVWAGLSGRLAYWARMRAEMALGRSRQPLICCTVRIKMRLSAGMPHDLPPLPAALRAALIRELDRAALTFAETLDFWDDTPKPEEMIAFLREWNVLPPAEKSAWQRAADRENLRRLTLC